MKISITKAFEKDIAKISDASLGEKVLGVIHALKTASRLSEIKNLKKLKGEGDYFRIRVGQYRIGLKLEQETVYLLRFMSRKDIYKYFP